MKTFSIINCLPQGYVTDGSVDYTSYLQQAINANDVIDFPPFLLMVNDRGLLIPSDRVLNNPRLRQKPSANGSYNAIRLQKVNNVTIVNLFIEGERQKHIGTTGEWGHGIALYGASNITIENPNITQCWGDGIYVAGSDGMPSRNVIINNAICTYCRRNGIAIVSVIGLTLNNPMTDRTWGVLPMCGIDIEPANKTDDIQDVVINNPQTSHSTEYGISIGLSELLGGSDKVIDVTITGWIDSYSKAALRASVNLNRRTSTETISGTIDIISPFWKDNSVAPWQVDIRTPDIKLNISNPVVRKNLTPAEMQPILTNKVNLNANHTITYL